MTTLVHSPLKAIELVGTVGKDHLLQTYRPLPLPEHTQVRIIVLYPESEELEPLTDKELEGFGAEFSAALAESGYDTKEKIAELVQEVKREQVKEWYGIE
jgi:hypothetical protein